MFKLLLIQFADWIYTKLAVAAPQPSTHNDQVAVEVVRLSPDVYSAFVNQLPPIHVGPTTTDLQAGYALGVQLVLEKLRKEIVRGH